MTQTAKFWNKMAERYAKSPIKDEEAYQRKLEVTRSYFRPEMNVIEIACGTGTTAISHAPHVNHILAIDISSNMLEIARGKAAAESIENISFEEATIETFDAAGKTYDLAMAHSILHLLEDPESAIAKVYEMLKPGGVFVTSTVCLGDSRFPWGIVIAPARLLGFAPYVNSLKRSELESYFLEAGFQIDLEWERNKSNTAFVVLRKPADVD
ncbi:MAG: class I SAM-dependent methyltransferase [Halioglobus sp.]